MTDLLLIKVTPVGLSFKEVIKENTVAQNKAHSKCLVDQNLQQHLREVWDVKGKKIRDYVGIILKFDQRTSTPEQIILH